MKTTLKGLTLAVATSATLTACVSTGSSYDQSRDVFTASVPPQYADNDVATLRTFASAYADKCEDMFVAHGVHYRFGMNVLSHTRDDGSYNSTGNSDRRTQHFQRYQNSWQDYPEVAIEEMQQALTNYQQNLLEEHPAPSYFNSTIVHEVRIDTANNQALFTMGRQFLHQSGVSDATGNMNSAQRGWYQRQRQEQSRLFMDKFIHGRYNERPTLVWGLPDPEMIDERSGGRITLVEASDDQVTFAVPLTEAEVRSLMEAQLSGDAELVAHSSFVLEPSYCDVAVRGGGRKYSLNADVRGVVVTIPALGDSGLPVFTWYEDI